jgi:hypothetical protein
MKPVPDIFEGPELKSSQLSFHISKSSEKPSGT